MTPALLAEPINHTKESYGSKPEGNCSIKANSWKTELARLEAQLRELNADEQDMLNDIDARKSIAPIYDQITGRWTEMKAEIYDWFAPRRHCLFAEIKDLRARIDREAAKDQD